MPATKPAKLPLAISTLYAELLDLSEDDYLLGYAAGSYVSKNIKGKAYWYYQQTVGKERQQKYLGPETPELLDEIKSRKSKQMDRRKELSRRKEICQALTAGARIRMDSTTARILKALAEAGAYAAGAVLIGSHAYGIYPAMLGRKFSAANLRTGDVDFAAIHIAVSEPVSFAEVITTAEKNMLLVPPAPHAKISTKLKMRGADYRIELLTPAHGNQKKPIVLNNLKFGAQPLPYLDFLIEDPVDAVAPVDVGIRVKVPAPEKYALHKLIVAQARETSQFAKREKDLAQAMELLSILQTDLPAELSQAWDNLVDRGPDYSAKAITSLDQLGIAPPT